MNRALISASVMCANQLDLARDIDCLVAAGVDYLHLDVMDGSFVPNVTLGIGTINTILQKYSTPADIHLLVSDPASFIEWIDIRKEDRVSAHVESGLNVEQISKYCQQRGVKFGLVLNPKTSINVLAKYLNNIDFVNLMMVEPGFAGRNLNAEILQKITDCRAFLDCQGFSDMEIEVDGNVSFQYAPTMRQNGADIFVAGSSSIFKRENLSDGVRELRESIS